MIIHRKIKSYARREGRSSETQKKLFVTYWPKFGIDLPIENKTFFARKAPLMLDIGFGMGDSLIHLAKLYPEANCLGIDVFRTGCCALLNKLISHSLDNVKIINHDAVEILTHSIDDHSVSRIQIFFPDPWPKQRHHKRRLIQASFLDLIAKKLVPQGILHIATDWQDYAQQIDRLLLQHEAFQATVSQSRATTKYELRAKRLGHQIWDFCYQLC